VTAQRQLAPRLAWLFAGVLFQSLSCAAPQSRVPQQQAAAAASPTAATVAALSIEPSRDIEDLLSDANASEDAGLFEQAIAKFEEILRIRPREVRAMSSVAALKGKLRHFDDELAWADRAIETDSRFAPAWVNRGNALGSLDRLEEADVAFGRALQLEPMLPEAHNGRGVVADAREDFDTAVYHYREAVKAEPRFEDGWFNLASALASMHRFDEAVAALQQVLQLNPDAADAQAMLAELTSRAAETPTPARR
jgi:tetratricopeptide (TPR) repeat protein